jgi:hypothetical protein
MFPHQGIIFRPKCALWPFFKFAQAVTLLTCIQKVPGSNPERDTNQTKGVWPKQCNNWQICCDKVNPFAESYKRVHQIKLKKQVCAEDHTVEVKLIWERE